jgi:hypothetical protein
MRGCRSYCSGGGPLPVCKIAFLSVSVPAEVIPARWPAVIFRALLRHCCACLLAVSDSVAAVLSGPSFDLPVFRDAPRLRGQMLAD